MADKVKLKFTTVAANVKAITIVVRNRQGNEKDRLDISPIPKVPFDSKELKHGGQNGVVSVIGYDGTGGGEKIVFSSTRRLRKA
jgi:hypothetical protein